MTREELKKLSDDTFYDNNVGGISPYSHRAFNNNLIDAIPDPVGLASNTALGKVMGSTELGKVRVEADGTMSVIPSGFTFVVDSDQALNDWADQVEGNDYTSVLIMPGTWNITNKYIGLQQAGTKAVVGLPGSILNFEQESVTSCLVVTYTNRTKNDEYIKGVTVTAKFRKTGGGVFRNARNLSNCVVNCETSVGVVSGFVACINLTNCTSNTTTSATGGGVMMGAFAGCRSLINCEAIAIGIAGIYGFYECVDLVFCKGAGKGTNSGYGFFACKVMFGCSPLEASTSETYSRCSMSTTSSISVGETAEGGYNR